MIFVLFEATFIHSEVDPWFIFDSQLTEDAFDPFTIKKFSNVLGSIHGCRFVIIGQLVWHPDVKWRNDRSSDRISAQLTWVYPTSPITSQLILLDLLPTVQVSFLSVVQSAMREDFQIEQHPTNLSVLCFVPPENRRKTWSIFSVYFKKFFKYFLGR